MPTSPRPDFQLPTIACERCGKQMPTNGPYLMPCPCEDAADGMMRAINIQTDAAQLSDHVESLKRELASAQARIAELTKERDEAAERAGRAEQAMSSLRVLHAEGGQFHVTLDVAKEVAAAICDCLAALTDNAKNYVECSMTNKHGDRWIMTIIKPTGNTPHDMRVEAEKERDDAVKRVGDLERERDAYRKAKQENDERFMLERDAARAEVEKLKALLVEAAQVIDANGYESGNQMFNVLIGGAPWSRDPIGVLKRINTALAAGNDRAGKGGGG